MGVVSEPTRGIRGIFGSLDLVHGMMVLAAGLFLLLGSSVNGWAVQRHTLLPQEELSAGQGSQAEESAARPTHETVETQAAGSQTHAGSSQTRAGETATHRVPATGGQSTSGRVLPKPEERNAVVEGRRGLHKLSEPSSVRPTAETQHEGAPEGAYGGMEEGRGEGHLVLPTISSTPGVTFVETLINLMDYELNGRFLGWRPNDLIIGRFTDNINNYQLGVLEAIRFTTLRLKDSLTRMGEADTYDRDLESALNLFMNKATLFWFPSAESSYSEAVDHLKKFLEKLKSGRRSFYYRVDNLLSLIASYGDLLGNVNKTLAVQVNPDGSPISWFDSDDYFYYAKGVAHVMFEILKVVRVGFENQLVTIDAIDIMDEILHELNTAEKMSPWIILDSSLDGFFANHRANLNAPLSEVAHLLGVMSRF